MNEREAFKKVQLFLEGCEREQTSAIDDHSSQQIFWKLDGQLIAYGYAGDNYAFVSVVFPAVLGSEYTRPVYYDDTARVLLSSGRPPAQKLYTDSHTDFYSNYRGRSVGRILHYIYRLCGLHYAERVEVGDSIKYNGRPFAEIHWVRWSDDSSVEWPEFEFAPEYRGRPNKFPIKPYDNKDDLLREAVHQARESKKLLNKIAEYHKSDEIQVDFNKRYCFDAARVLNDLGDQTCPNA